MQKIETLEFQGKNYPSRWTQVEDVDVLVSTDELGKAMITPDGDFRNQEAIDCPVSCFVPEHAIISMNDDEFARYVGRCCYGVA